MNTILAVFAVLVSLWAWLSARNARDGVASVLRLVNARLKPLVDEAEGHKRPPTWRDVPPPVGQVVPIRKPQAVEETPVDAKSSETDDGAGSASVALGQGRPASPRPPHGGGRQGPSEATRDLAVKAKEILATRGDVAPVELRDELGLTIKGFAKVRALLNADPDVVTYGQTKTRRYKLRDGAPTAAKRQKIASEAAADGRSPKMPNTPGPKRGRQQPRLDGRVMSSIQVLPKSAFALGKELGAPLDEIVATLRRLEAEGDVRRHESGNWVAVP